MVLIEEVVGRVKASKTIMALIMLAVVGTCVVWSVQATIVLMVLVGVVAAVEMRRVAPKAAGKLKADVLITALFAQVVLGLAALCWLRLQPQGLLIILVVATAVFVNDGMAQFTGKRLKSQGHTLRPLASKISPNKSVEGLRGGLLGGWGAGLLAIAIVSLFTPGLPPLMWLVVLWCPPLAVVGDLVESAAKRSVGIKDFGTCLGKHGGICDRIDAITMATIGTVLILLISGSAL